VPGDVVVVHVDRACS